MQKKKWNVEPLPEARQAIKCKWTLDYKPGHKGVESIACGYDQLYGVVWLLTVR